MRNVITIDGPIPRMLTAAMFWLRANLSTTVVAGSDGAVRDVPEYPLVALRELVANTLVHRDIDDWSQGMAVELRLQRDRLILTNPGGLYGITVDRLGAEHVTSARNAHLVSLCEHAQDPDDGARVIEALASGLPLVAAALAQARLAPARFTDAGLHFTVILTNGTVPAPSTTTQQAPHTATLTTPAAGSQLAIIHAALLAHGIQSVAGLAASTGIKDGSVRRALTRLRHEYNLVTVVEGGPGKPTTYRAADSG